MRQPPVRNHPVRRLPGESLPHPAAIPERNHSDSNLTLTIHQDKFFEDFAVSFKKLSELGSKFVPMEEISLDF